MLPTITYIGFQLAASNKQRDSQEYTVKRRMNMDVCCAQRTCVYVYFCVYVYLCVCRHIYYKLKKKKLLARKLQLYR